MSEYAKRDIIAQGQHFMRHMMVMTAEDLNSKADIAAELAHRDIEIESLRQQLAEAQRDADRYRASIIAKKEKPDDIR